VSSPPTDAARSRQLLAEEIASVYIANPAVRMVTLTGSAATGAADERSDVDIGVHWRDRVDDDWLREPRLPVRASRFRFDTWSDGVAELYEIDGVVAEILHSRYGDAWEDVLRAVLERGEFTGANLFQLDGLVRQVVLQGDGEYEAVRARLSAFPDDLRGRLIEHHLSFPWLVQMTKAAERGDLLLLADLTVEALKKGLVVLGALNRLYMSSMWPRRTVQALTGMAIAPAHASERLESILLSQDCRASVSEIASFLIEIVELVEREVPEVDTSVARRRLTPPRFPS
jgi:predicted nucleotidyltransferase